MHDDQRITHPVVQIRPDPLQPPEIANGKIAFPLRTAERALITGGPQDQILEIQPAVRIRIQRIRPLRVPVLPGNRVAVVLSALIPKLKIPDFPAVPAAQETDVFLPDSGGETAPSRSSTQSARTEKTPPDELLSRTSS